MEAVVLLNLILLIVILRVGGIGLDDKSDTNGEALKAVMISILGGVNFFVIQYFSLPNYFTFILAVIILISLLSSHCKKASKYRRGLSPIPYSFYIAFDIPYYQVLITVL